MIVLRPANLEDLPLLRFWDEQPHNIDADPNDDWDWETELAHNPDWREQLVAELDGRPIGFIQIIDPARESSHYWGDIEKNQRAIDIWMGEAHDIGKGYGTVMMRLALERCFNHPDVEAVWLDPLESNVRAIKFYEKIGFEFVEYRQFGLDYCAVYCMSRVRWGEIE